ncbi:MAG: site-specific DNA-methyltransferase [Nitrososphaerales archaeon]
MPCFLICQVFIPPYGRWSFLAWFLIKHLGDIFDQVKRVLKKTGNCFIVIGDTYAGGGGTTGGYTQSWEKNADHRPKNRLSQKIVGTQSWIKRKQLLLIPYRLAIELQMRGWIVRDLIVWAKKVAFVDKEGEVVNQMGNGIPESVKDRLTKAYEVIIHAVKSPKYYFLKPTAPRKYQIQKSNNYNGKYLRARSVRNRYKPKEREISYACNVLQINTEPSPLDHFALMPTKLVKFLIKAGCPEGGTVLDPFMGAGTVALVAQELGRKWIGVEINPDYAKIAQKRVSLSVDKYSTSGLGLSPRTFRKYGF